MSNQDLYRLLEQQLSVWPLARQNYEKLQRIQSKTFSFGNFSLRLLFNPARAVSSQAKLDWINIAQRPCFLCKKNRPTEQEGLDYVGKYEILINPYPITQQHFTVVDKQHCGQGIVGRLPEFFDLAAQYTDFVVLFNGAKAGASAPDHAHFQLCNKTFFHLPVATDMEPIIHKKVWHGSDASALQHNLHDYIAQRDETLCNVFCQKEGDDYVVTVFPRQCHRPRQFFDGSLLISPGAIDMTGSLVVTRQQDYELITASDLSDIFQQVSGQV